MSFAPWSRKLVALGSLAILSASLVSFGWSADPPKDKPAEAPAEKPPKYYSASSCMRCHTMPTGSDPQDFVLLTEYATWRMQDRHSLAYFSLVGDRGQQMAKILNADVLKKETGCLNCHSMHAIPKDQRDPDFKLEEGVSCDGCHGPAEKWIGPHQFKEWRQKTAQEKEALGLFDLRNPARRAEICLSCHVGNVDQGKVITHAMYAAGHPPLPNFEVSCFSKRLPQHWRNKRDVPFFKNAPENIKKNYHLDTADFQQTQLVVASSLVGLRQALQLTAQRSDVAAMLDPAKKLERWPELALKNDLPEDPAQRWPEFALAQADCYSCHHELVRPSWRQVRGFSGAPGRPQLQPWPFALSDGGIGLGTDQPARQKNARMREFAEKIHDACNLVPFGNADKLHKAANALADWAANRAKQGNLQDTKYAHFALLQDLSSVPGDAYPDYNSARQTVAAWMMVWNEWPSKPAGKEEIQKLLDELVAEFDLDVNPIASERLKLLAAKLGKSEDDKNKLLPDASAVEAAQAITNQGLDATYPISDKDKDKKKEAVAKELRRYLNAIRDKAGKDFTDALMKDKAFLKELQAINDKDLQGALQKVAEYDPKLFKKRMARLLKMLEANK